MFLVSCNFDKTRVGKSNEEEDEREDEVSDFFLNKITERERKCVKKKIGGGGGLSHLISSLLLRIFCLSSVFLASEREREHTRIIY